MIHTHAFEFYDIEIEEVVYDGIAEFDYYIETGDKEPPYTNNDVILTTTPIRITILTYLNGINGDINADIINLKEKDIPEDLKAKILPELDAQIDIELETLFNEINEEDEGEQYENETAERFN
jgi:hypothetical protein